MESLKSYIGKISEKEFMRLTKCIYDITASLCLDYPHYKDWYFKKQLPRFLMSKGYILFIRKKEDPKVIIAMASLKKDESEKKICTLFVVEQYRMQHLGSELIRKSLLFLETTKPVITFADYKLFMFQSIIDKYNWQLTDIVEDLHKELVYNRRC